MRVATWNLYWRFGDWEPRQPLISSVLREQAPAVCLLQETWPTQAEQLASELGLEMLVFEGGYFDQEIASIPTDEQFGNAILVDASLGAELVHAAAFPGPGDPAPRNLLVTRVGDSLFATSHLSHMGDAHDLRIEQVTNIASVLDSFDEPALFCGDHNMVPSSPEHQATEDLGFVDEWLAQHPDLASVDEFGATMNPENPEIEMTSWMDDRNNGNAPLGSGVRLDYVWTRPGSTGARPVVGAIERFGPIEGDRWPSDHLGLAFDIEG